MRGFGIGHLTLAPGLRQGAREAAPIAVAVFLIGASFGVIAAPLMGDVAPIVMSVVVFSGGAQFGATAVLADGGGPGTAILAGILLNARFLPMGAAIGPSLRGGRLRRALVGQAVVDSSWAMAKRAGGRFDRHVLIGATLPQYPAWVLGTVAGVFAGDAIGDPQRLGLDALFPAFFLVLLAEELRQRGAVRAALAGAAIALALIPVAPAGVPVLAASLAALIGVRR